MSQISSMFLRNVTCIDHAYINAKGLIVGGSYHQQLIVSGDVDEHEQVVVDFSKVKKQIKGIIDDQEHGYDHKLWLIEGVSYCEIEPLEDGYLHIKTPELELVIPNNAVKLVEDNSADNEFLSYKQLVTLQMEKELTEGLNKANNTNCIKVDLKLTTEAFSEEAVKFTYFHGLKHSTSWGCKNIAHGHTSFVEVYSSSGSRLPEVEYIIQHYLNGAMMVFVDNLVEPNKIEYDTSRGRFSLKFSNNVKHIKMTQETTIENIIEHVVETMRPTLEYYNVHSVCISEGLQKGALKILP